MQARDERAVCEVGRGDGQPVERSKPRVGHELAWADGRSSGGLPSAALRRALHSGFERIPLSRETQERFLKEQLHELEIRL